MKMGSAGKTALVYVIMLSLLLGTAAFIQFQASATIVKADVEIRPDRVDLGAEYPGMFDFTLSFSGKYKNYRASNISRDTVLVEGIIPPKPGKGRNWKIDEEANTLTFRVWGDRLIPLVIWPKVYHMARVDPNPDKGTWFPYWVDITVTGEFTDGTPFSGTGRIRAYGAQSESPPPPPPPEE